MIVQSKLVQSPQAKRSPPAWIWTIPFVLGWNQQFVTFFASVRSCGYSTKIKSFNQFQLKWQSVCISDWPTNSPIRYKLTESSHIDSIDVAIVAFMDALLLYLLCTCTRCRVCALQQNSNTNTVYSKWINIIIQPNYDVYLWQNCGNQK